MSILCKLNIHKPMALYSLEQETEITRSVITMKCPRCEYYLRVTIDPSDSIESFNLESRLLPDPSVQHITAYYWLIIFLAVATTLILGLKLLSGEISSFEVAALYLVPAGLLLGAILVLRCVLNHKKAIGVARDEWLQLKKLQFLSPDAAQVRIANLAPPLPQ